LVAARFFILHNYRKKEKMDLILPDYGLLFWTGLVFISLVFVLTKFAWKPILKMVNEREKQINDSLKLAEQTKKEMKQLKADNEELLKKARKERDEILKDAKEVADRMIGEAKTQAQKESGKLLESARQTIEAEKAAAISELKTQVAAFSLQIAESIVRSEMSSDEKQKALAAKMAEDINLN
jgi:F-type H+-transporting ATPase subunit b